MATGKVHDEHIANILGKEFSLKRPEELRLIQDAVYVLMDATVKDKNGRRLNEALHIRLSIQAERSIFKIYLYSSFF